MIVCVRELVYIALAVVREGGGAARSMHILEGFVDKSFCVSMRGREIRVSGVSITHSG